MSITIKTNKIPNLKKPSFNVDGKLDLKLDNYEITSLMNKSNFTVFLGKPGSGKSSLLISFLKTKDLYKKVFHSIILFMPPNSRQSIKDSFFDKYLPENQIYDELNLENLQAAYQISEANAQEDCNTLIIFDDCQRQFKIPENEKFLLHMASNRRHARLSIWFASQNYTQIPKQIRMSITDLYVFKVSKAEIENLLTEQIELPKSKFENVLKHVFQEPHDFLYINSNTQRMFSNWDELIYLEE